MPPTSQDQPSIDTCRTTLLIILSHSCTFYTGHTQEHRAACAHILPHVTLSILACCLTLTPCFPQLLERQLQREAGLPAEERRLFRLDHIAMWTVLRPGLRQMLARVAPLFQLWIQTNASRCAPLSCSPELRLNLQYIQTTEAGFPKNHFHTA